MMEHRPLVSVVVIFLNEEAFLEEAIQSIFAQAYDRWELLLVDDGSSDRSTAIARGWAEQHPTRVRYLEHPGHENRGMSASRNLGIGQARGELIALLDGDDVWRPEKLATQAAMLEEHPEVAMVYDAALMWSTWGAGGERRGPDRLRRLGAPSGTVVRPPGLLTLIIRRESDSPATCSLLVRREVVEKVGGFEEAYRGLYEDQIFLSKIFLEFPVLVADGSTSLYRQHARSTCHQAEAAGVYHPSRAHPAQRDLLDWIDRYMTDRGLRDDRVRQALDAALWPYRHPILYRLRTFKWRESARAKRAFKRVLRRRLPAFALRAITRLRGLDRRQTGSLHPG